MTAKRTWKTTAIRPARRTTNNNLYPYSDPASRSTDQLPLKISAGNEELSSSTMTPKMTYGSKYATAHIIPMPVCLRMWCTTTLVHRRRRVGSSAGLGESANDVGASQWFESCLVGSGSSVMEGGTWSLIGRGTAEDMNGVEVGGEEGMFAEG